MGSGPRQDAINEWTTYNFYQTAKHRDRHLPKQPKMNNFSDDLKLESPLGSLKNWKPYILSILEHFLERDMDSKQVSGRYEPNTMQTQEMRDQNPQAALFYFKQKWDLISNKLYMIQMERGVKPHCRTIQRSLLITKLALSKLDELFPIQSVDFGLIAFSALRMALKNQSNPISLKSYMKISQYSQEDLLQAEIFIINTLDWKLNVPTPYEFTECLLFAINPEVEWLPFIHYSEKVVQYCLTHYELSCNKSSTLAIAAILIVSENYNFDDINLETTGVQFQFALLQHLSNSSLQIDFSSAIILKGEILTKLVEEDPLCKFMRGAVRNHNELVQQLIDEQILNFEEMGKLVQCQEKLTIQVPPNCDKTNIFEEEHSLTHTICNDLAEIQLKDDERNGMETNELEYEDSYSSDAFNRWSHSVQKLKSRESSGESSEGSDTNPDSQFSNHSHNSLKSLKQREFHKKSFNLVKRIEDKISQKYRTKSSKFSAQNILPSSTDQLNQHLHHEEL